MDILRQAQKFLKQLDTPEMRKLYSEEKTKDSSLDERVNELTKQIEKGFKHNVTPKK